MQTIAQAQHLGRNHGTALGRDVHDGLDVRKAADGVDRVGDASAAVEILQRIHAGVEDDALTQLLELGGDFLRALALIPQLHRILHQKPVTAGTVEAVHDAAV